MHAQRKTAGGPRRAGYNRPVPTRVRMGLVMRRDMDFGELGDVETALRAEGVGLAPISTGDASLVSGGVTVLATATSSDIAEGRLKGLIVPGGSQDETALAAVRSLIDLALAQGLPVFAFADGVAIAAERFGLSAEAPGAMFADGAAKLLNERSELSVAVAAV